MNEHDTLTKLQVQLDKMMELYRQTKDDTYLIKANEYRVAYAELDVKLNGHQGAKP